MATHMADLVASDVNWHTTKDPHPSAISNLRKFAEHMVQHGITTIETAETFYALSRDLNHDYMNTKKLLGDRPGFILVEYERNKFRVFYDVRTFGNEYPSTYRAQRGKTLVSRYLLSEIRPESAAEPKITNRAANEIVKQLGTKFDFEPVGSDKTTSLARVPYRPLSGTFTTNEVRETVLSAINSGHLDRAAIILTGIAAAVSKGDLTVTD